MKISPQKIFFVFCGGGGGGGGGGGSGRGEGGEGWGVRVDMNGEVFVKIQKKKFFFEGVGGSG